MNRSRISRIQKIYIAGFGGMLGDAFYKQFNNYELKCTDIDVNENWLSYLDIRSFTDYRDDVIKFNPQYLFHLGAFTDLEYCELHPKDTYETNTQSVEYGVKIANELNIPILFISTAGIFNGKKNIYDENDTPDPIGHYAKSKYLA
jgi:dTDP-4-dehydrorhamnose reductase